MSITTKGVGKFLAPSLNASSSMSGYVNNLEVWDSTGVIAEGRWGLSRAAAQPLFLSHKKASFFNFVTHEAICFTNKQGLEISGLEYIIQADER